MTLAASLHLPRLFNAEPIARGLARLRRAWELHRAYLALLDEFERMSERDWLDLGLSRHSARELARATVYGR